MAISRQFKSIYEENETEYVFSTRAFRQAMQQYVSMRNKEDDDKYTQEKFLSEVGEKINKSPEAIKQWIRGNNGPSDIGVVKDIAEIFDVDFKRMLVPRKILSDKDKEIDFKVTANDEKSVVMQFHAILSDFIYDYIGGDFRDLFIDRRYGVYAEDIDKDIADFIFNLYKQLEKVALALSVDTYQKLHRYITECKVFAYNGMDEATPHLYGLVMQNPRWIEANPYLKTIANYSYSTSFEDTLFFWKKDEIEELVEPFKKEASCDYIGSASMGFWSDYRGEHVGLGVDEADKAQYISGDDVWEYFFYEPYEAVPMELAKTLTMLFRKDFPQFFDASE